MGGRQVTSSFQSGDKMTSLRIRSFLKPVTLALLPILLISLTPTPANAWWFLFKKKHKTGATSNQKKREVAGVPVGLVPGNPPALYWKPDKTPRAAVLCLHELGFYNGVFDDLGKRLSAQGLATYAIDLRGFGGWTEIKSPDSKMDLDKTLEDVKGSVEVMHKLHPGIPVFVLGEAMGGALALKAAATFPELIQGAITAAPGGEHHKTMKNYMTIASKLAVAGPNNETSYGEDLLEIATPKKELQDAFREDPKVRLDLAPRELMDCQFFMYKTRQMARKIKNVPVLVVHGEKDGESKEIGSEKVYKNLATKDKEYLKVADGDHYTFEDVKVSDAAFNSTLSWIDKHISAQ
jgi:alpha-beta hydrolase superfamily lysophospholipase